jgi:hypothetical protein
MKTISGSKMNKTREQELKEEIKRLDKRTKTKNQRDKMKSREEKQNKQKSWIEERVE